jgi:ABC-2 type transport system permease protein
MRIVRLIGIHLKVAVLNEVQYRANFFLSLVQSLVTMGTGLFVLTLVFDRVRELNGWSRPELLVLLGVFTALGGVVRMVIKPNVKEFIDNVREGTLDYVFTKPVDGQLLVTIRTLRLWQGTDVLTGAVLVSVGLSQLHRFGPAAAAGFACAALLGTIMIYSVLMMLGTTAFWFVQSHQIMEFFDSIWQAGRWPVGIYPGWLRIGLTVIVPIGFSVTAPAQALMSRLSGTTLLAMAALSAFLFAAARVYWRFGLRRYTGASA